MLGSRNSGKKKYNMHPVYSVFLESNMTLCICIYVALFAFLITHFVIVQLVRQHHKIDSNPYVLP